MFKNFKNNMKKLQLIQLIILSIILIIPAKASDMKEENPFYQEYQTPYHVPPFEKIKIEHYVPAFKEGMSRQKAEIDFLVNKKEAPSFSNTIEALEYSGELLNKVSEVFYNMNSANTNPEIQAIAKEIAPMLSKHSDDIMLNTLLFARVKEVYNQKDKLKLNTEQSRLLEETYKNFIRSGANLAPKQQEELRKINQELSVLTLKFGENTLAETNKFKLVLRSDEELAGLPTGIIEGAKQAAKESGEEGYLFTLHNPSVMPFLQYSMVRDNREKMFIAYSSRGNNNDGLDNKDIINKIVNLRLKKANLLGYSSHSDFVLEESMAKKPLNVYKLLNELWGAALPVTQQELAELNDIASRDNIVDFKTYDWRFYAERLRKEKYNLDEEELRPYFELNNVKDGIFYLSNKLYGLSFVERKDIPKYHNDVVVYEVLDQDKSHLGVLYMDFFPRESKRGGAWMSDFRAQYIKEGKMINPVISIVGNFSKPTPDMPALLTFDEVSTFFHEFGHALHGLLSKCTYRSLSGTNVPRDFVELPSQIMENWATEPEMLKVYAKHYNTKQIIPDELVKKIIESQHFNQGFATTEYLAASFLDMAYHTLSKPQEINIEAFEKKILDSLGLIPQIISRYRSTYFNHIFSGGYSSGYYSYIWSEVLDSDAFQAFKEKGIFDKQTSESFRKNILEKGFTDDPMQLYKNFRGKEPSIEPLLIKRGLL